MRAFAGTKKSPVALQVKVELDRVGYRLIDNSTCEEITAFRVFVSGVLGEKPDKKNQQLVLH